MLLGLEPCRLLPGAFGLLVQMLLFGCCCGVLCIKKWKEGPSRTWRVFLLDSSKQLMGAGMVHGLNILLSWALHERTSLGDDCDWYWLHIMIDTTLGVLIEVCLLRVLTYAVETLTGNYKDFRSGQYTNAAGEIVVGRYLRQLAIWLTCAALMKIAITGLLYVMDTEAVSAARFVLGSVREAPRLKLVLVMIVTPLCMNAFQLWVTDSYIKAHDSEDGEDAFLIGEDPKGGRAGDLSIAEATALQKGTGAGAATASNAPAP